MRHYDEEELSNFTYLQLRLLLPQESEDLIYNYCTHLPKYIVMQYVRDNPHNLKILQQLINNKLYDCLNNINDLLLCNLKHTNVKKCVCQLYDSYVDKMIAGVTTNWNLHSYTNALQHLYLNCDDDMWELTKKILNRTNDTLSNEFFSDRWFYYEYMHKHLNDWVLPLYYDISESVVSKEDKEELIKLVSKNKVNMYVDKKTVLNNMKKQ